MTMTKRDKSITIRIDGDTLTLLKDRANKNYRTIASEILLILHNDLKAIKEIK
jgi:predicted DNA binding CopG/RHH family protein